MKKIAIIAVIMLLSIPLFSESNQRTQEEMNYQGHYVGGAAGFGIGYGLSYRYMPAEWGFQINLAPEVTSGGRGVMAGVAVMRQLHQGRYTKLYLYGGGYYSFAYTDVSEWDSNEEVLEFDHDFCVSLGPGFEINTLENVTFDTKFGYSFSTWQDGLGFSVDTGIYYHF